VLSLVHVPCDATSAVLPSVNVAIRRNCTDVPGGIVRGPSIRRSVTDGVGGGGGGGGGGGDGEPGLSHAANEATRVNAANT
jgi:hypothetical protein